MNQELKAFRDWLRAHSQGGIEVTGTAGAHMTVTQETVRELAAILDDYQRRSEHVGGEQRDV